MTSAITELGNWHKSTPAKRKLKQFGSDNNATKLFSNLTNSRQRFTLTDFLRSFDRTKIVVLAVWQIIFYANHT